MKDQSGLMMIVVVVVTFIAGYSIVSYVLRKFREGAAHRTQNDQDQQRSNPPDEDM